MQEQPLSQRVHEMKEMMLADIILHPNQEAYTFQVRRDDLIIASLAGAALCTEMLTPIVVVEDKEEERECQEPLFS